MDETYKLTLNQEEIDILLNHLKGIKQDPEAVLKLSGKVVKQVKEQL